MPGDRRDRGHRYALPFAAVTLAAVAMAVGVSWYAGAATIVGVHRLGSAAYPGPYGPSFYGPGASVAPLGDLDGDGVVDFLASTPDDWTSCSSGGYYEDGSAWATFLNQDFTIESWREVSNLAAFLPVVDRARRPPHGSDQDVPKEDALAVLGDIDGDGNVEVAVGYPDAQRADGTHTGSVFLASLATDGTTVGARRIDVHNGTFRGVLDDGARFGSSLAALGDLDGDGVVDLAVGSPGDSEVGDSTDARRGAIWILFLARDRTVKSAQKIDTQQGGFQGPLSEGDELGRALAGVGDMDGDGIVDLAAGAPGDDTGGRDRGAVWLLFLNADGSVKSTRKIAAGRAGFTGNVENRDRFGAALAALGDVDGDGAVDLAVGAPFDDDGGWRLASDYGAVWLLFLDASGAVRDHRKISATSGGLTASLGAGYHFGASIAAIGDVDGDGGLELAIGAPDDREDFNVWPRYAIGAVWIVSLPPVDSTTCGDGVTVGMEQCDDGNTVVRDGCDERCRVEAGFTCTGVPSHCDLTCSDGVISPHEECDDGNRADGDGCDARCRVESEFFCRDQPSQCHPVTTTTTTTGGTTTSISYWFSTTTTPDPLGVCGDGTHDYNYEGCDDGNLEPDDGCSQFCRIEDGWQCTSETAEGTSSCIRVCGDGVKLPCLSEECDDGNLIDGDGCNHVCDVEPGFACTNGPTVCYRCGDGRIDPVEQCDQGNGDSPGCDATCFVAPGWACDGEPSVCTYLCGNDVRDEGEECDDAGLTGGDGCSPACTIEPDWRCIGSPSTCTPRGPVTTTTTTLPPACGDANGDRRVTSSDALQALLAAIGLGECASEFCDVDGSDTVSAVDALAILREAVGLPTQLACP